MKKLQNVTNKVSRKALEAGLYATALMAPASTLAQQTQIEKGLKASGGTGSEKDIFSQTGIFKQVADVLLLVVGAISVIMLIVGGLKYVLSGGDSNKVESAKNTILYAIVGIVIALLAFAAVNFVVDSFKP